MREITTIEIKKTTRADITTYIFQLARADIRTPDDLIKHLIKTTAEQSKELMHKQDVINQLTGAVGQALTEQARPAGEVRTVPASGKLSIEKYAGKKVSVSVIE